MPSKNKAQLIEDAVTLGLPVSQLQGLTNDKLRQVIRQRKGGSVVKRKRTKGGCAGCNGACGGSLLNKAINKLPIEAHMWDQGDDGRYRKSSYIGPGTRLDKRLDEKDNWYEWSKPINDLDLGAYHHDLCYRDNKDTKTRTQVCDPALQKRARAVRKNKKSTKIQKANALAVEKIMAGKNKFGMGCDGDGFLDIFKNPQMSELSYQAKKMNKRFGNGALDATAVLGVARAVKESGQSLDRKTKLAISAIEKEYGPSRSGGALPSALVPILASAGKAVASAIIGNTVASANRAVKQEYEPTGDPIMDRLNYLRNGGGVALIGDGLNLLGDGTTLVGGALKDDLKQFWQGFKFGFLKPVEAIELLTREAIHARKRARGRKNGRLLAEKRAREAKEKQIRESWGAT